MPTKTRKSQSGKTTIQPNSQKRVYVKQSDVPSASLEEALRIPQAILEHYAGKPTSPLHVAKALNVDPGGTQLKVLSGAAIGFGLIDGGAQAPAISVTELAKTILRPKEEGADLFAKREAVLKPRIFSEFLRNYDGNNFPREDIVTNVLEGMGVPRAKAAETLSRILASAEAVGFIENIKGKRYVSLEGFKGVAQEEGEPTGDRNTAGDDDAIIKADQAQRPLAKPGAPASSTALAAAIIDDDRRRKVFITHGSNRDLISPISKLLEFGELTPIVSVERSSVSKPVPEKVMDDMRSCGAAIIHVDVERTIIDKDGNEHVQLNPNVLIEIGAAMAFYGRRFILLVRDGVRLPSNLQGLFEVRYSGEAIDANATIKLLEAIKDIKNYALPSDHVANED